MPCLALQHMTVAQSKALEYLQMTAMNVIYSDGDYLYPLPASTHFSHDENSWPRFEESEGSEGA